MGLLRLLTNAAVMGHGRKSIPEAWAIVDELRTDRRIVFAAEPGNIEFT